MHAIRVSKTGGPEALAYVEVTKPQPKDDEAVVKLHAIGVNFIDVYHRTGLYPLPLPFTPGSEGAGIVESVGSAVKGLKPGDRVAYAMAPGAYAEYASVAASKLVPMPDAIDFKTAAASMLQGMTAHYLVTSLREVREGTSVLVHAAAGGVGGILVQMAKQRGAKVFGTASGRHLDIVRKDGADVAIDYTKDDFEEIVLRETAGAGVDAVYDSVGRTTFDKSLNCTGLRGTLALFGQSSGTVAPVDPSRLAKNGIFLTRPSLGHYTKKRDELLWRAGELFEGISSGKVHIRIDRELPLRDAAEAHRLLEGRKTTGKLLLIP